MGKRIGTRTALGALVLAAAVLAPGPAAPAAAPVHLDAGSAGEPPVCTEPAPLRIRTDAPPRTVSLWCHDGAHNPVQIVVDVPPAHGELVQPEGWPPTYRTYEVDDGYEGEDSFIYHGRSADGDSEPVTQRIVVDPEHNTPPQCGQVALRVRPGQTRTMGVSCFDQDVDAVTVEIATPPAHGSVTVPDQHGLSQYTAHPTYTGSDPFSLRADDGHGGVVTVPVEITVTDDNSAPSCLEGALAVGSGKSIVMSPPICSDPEGDPLTTEIATPPRHGVITEANGLRTFTAHEGYVGWDEFTVQASDGRLKSAPATVKVQITESLDTTPECDDKAVSVPADGSVVIELLCYDRDLDSPALEILRAPPPEAGTLVPIDEWWHRPARFTPARDFRGTTQFTYGAFDGRNHSAPATVTITVTEPQSPGVTTATAVSVAMEPVRAQRLGRVTSRGLALRVDLEAAATLKVTLVAPHATARRLRLGRRAVVIGTLTRSLKAGRTTVTVRPRAKARRALRRVRSARLRVAIVATDAAGNRRSRAATVTLRR